MEVFLVWVSSLANAGLLETDPGSEIWHPKFNNTISGSKHHDSQTYPISLGLHRLSS